MDWFYSYHPEPSDQTFYTRQEKKIVYKGAGLSYLPKPLHYTL